MPRLLIRFIATHLTSASEVYPTDLFQRGAGDGEEELRETNPNSNIASLLEGAERQV